MSKMKNNQNNNKIIQKMRKISKRIMKKNFAMKNKINKFLWSILMIMENNYTDLVYKLIQNKILNLENIPQKI